jgi:hypothetical protein
VGEHRDPLDNSNAYVGTGYGMPHQAVPWGVQAPSTGQDRPADQRAARELELATTDADNRGVANLSAGISAMLNAAASVVVLWLLGGLVGFFLAVVTGVFAVIFGLRARRSAEYRRNRSWWLGTAAIAITVVSLVSCFTYNVLLPDKGSSATATCGVAGSCPAITGR